MELKQFDDNEIRAKDMKGERFEFFVKIEICSLSGSYHCPGFRGMMAFG